MWTAETKCGVPGEALFHQPSSTRYGPAPTRRVERRIGARPAARPRDSRDRAAARPRTTHLCRGRGRWSAGDARRSCGCSGPTLGASNSLRCSALSSSPRPAATPLQRAARAERRRPAAPSRRRDTAAPARPRRKRRRCVRRSDAACRESRAPRCRCSFIPVDRIDSRLSSGVRPNRWQIEVSADPRSGVAGVSHGYWPTVLSVLLMLVALGLTVQANRRCRRSDPDAGRFHLACLASAQNAAVAAERGDGNRDHGSREVAGETRRSTWGSSAAKWHGCRRLSSASSNTRACSSSVGMSSSASISPRSCARSVSAFERSLRAEQFSFVVDIEDPAPIDLRRIPRPSNRRWSTCSTMPSSTLGAVKEVTFACARRPARR